VERLTRTLVVCAVAAITIAVPRDARAYSVLAHEANVDALWDRAIVPLLEKRFPHATREDIRNARAYAYGGSVIQDLGYYPFGSKFFSNLLHYVRSGDFVEFALRDARTVDEYAFALGTLGHYASDTTGHPEAVNKAVALMFPKLRQKFGNTVTYVDSPRRMSSSSSRSTSSRPRPGPTCPSRTTSSLASRWRRRCSSAPSAPPIRSRCTTCSRTRISRCRPTASR